MRSLWLYKNNSMGNTEREGQSRGEKLCVLLRTRKTNLLIGRRWRIRTKNYWRIFFLFFFQKSKDGADRLETVGDALNSAFCARLLASRPWASWKAAGCHCLVDPSAKRASDSQPREAIAYPAYSKEGGGEGGRSARFAGCTL